MKKTIFTIILGIIVGVALAACSTDNHLSNPSNDSHYVSEGTFDDLKSGKIESALVVIDDDTRVNISRISDSDLVTIREFKTIHEGVYEEVDSITSSIRSLSLLEDGIDRLL